MISVKDALTSLDREARAAEAARQNERLMRKCLGLWRQTLGAVSEYVFPLFPGAAQQAEDDWAQVHNCLCEEAPEEVLENTPRLVERVLHNYARQSRRAQQEEVEALKGLLATMAETAAASRTRTANYSGGVASFCDSLGQIAQSNDMAQLRLRLAVEATRLREDVARMVAESEKSMAEMEGELSAFRERLAAAEAAASTDALTGLSNRRELERQLEVRIQAMRPFCALLFDVDEFKSINDRFGHQSGDEVLRRFATILNEQVRPGDVVARWGGDEFFVILDCHLKDALRRCQQISEKLTRRYDLPAFGKRLSVPVRASSGVVEYTCGETAADLFRRVDQAMYAAKAQRAPQRPEPNG